MNKLKLGNRLKFFHRHGPSSPGSRSLKAGGPCSPGGQSLDVGNLMSGDISISSYSDDDFSTDSSLNSKDRNAGPIDVDTGRKDMLKVRTRVRLDGASARMPRIVESPSSCTPVNHQETSLGGCNGGDMTEATAPHPSPRHLGALSLSPRSFLFFKRERSGTLISPKSAQNATATPALAHIIEDEDADQPLKYMIPSQCSSGETQESNFINGNNTTEKEIDRTSPSSVIHMFNSSYPVEIDPGASDCKDSSEYKYSHAGPDEPNLLLPDLSYNYAHSENTNGYAIPADQKTDASTAPPEITSLALDSSSMTNAHATTSSNATCGNLCVVPPGDSNDASLATRTKASSGKDNNAAPDDKNCSSSAADSIVSGSSKDNKGSTSNKEFSELKKVAEKNEFKVMVALTNRYISTSLSVLSNLSSTSSDGLVGVELANFGEIVKMADEMIHGNNKNGAENPPDLFATNAIGSADPFIESTSSSAPQSSSKETSFTMEQDYEKVQNSFSSDSESTSYTSDESIGDISICNETTRLIEAHKLYVEDAKTNINHPARQKKSAMRVGSVFNNLANIQLNEPVPLSSDQAVKRTRSSSRFRSFTRTPSFMSGSCSIKTEENTSSLCSIKTQEKKNISWYDDELNWGKPLTLRTDESYEVSTVSSSTWSKGITQYNVMDHFIGDFINGICNSRVIVDFDVSEQEEI
jgi:hypothetical protein